MAPPPAPKRIKRPAVVLDEDTYVSAISHIVRRDFFPGLAEADAQREYLNAVESKNKSWIREAGKNLTQVMTPLPNGKRRAPELSGINRAGGSADRTPSVWGADTPVTVAGTELNEEDDEGLGRLDQVDLNMSLGAFQAKYSSEDQESFSQIIDAQNKKRFEKNAWAREGNMYASKQRIAQQKVLEARAADNESKQLAVTTRPSQNLDDRPAAPTTHKHTAMNNLMFGPEGIEDWAPTRASTAQSLSLAPPKQVVYNNTRLPVADTDTLPRRPPSPTLSAVRDAVAGRPRLNPSEAGYTGSETPRVNGYAFVDAHPPSDHSSDEDAPTDLLERFGVDSASTTTHFNLNETSKREKMALDMVDKINLKRANGTASSTSSAAPKPTGSGLGIFTSETPRFLSAPTPRLGVVKGAQTPGRKGKGDLTPAAQRLFERMGATPRRGISGGFVGGGGGSVGGMENGKGKEWTPTPRVKRKI